MSPRVSIIILNWNGWRDTVECLESVYQIDYPNYDVIVVDNGSNDDSIKRIKEYCAGKIRVESKFFEYDPTNKPIRVFDIDEEEARTCKFNKKLYEKYNIRKRLILIKNKKNYGFTGGNNIAMRFAMNVLDPKYILLLNNDTVVDKNFLSELVKVAESDLKIGIVQSKILRKDNPRIIDSTGHVFKWGKFIDRGHGEIDFGQYDRIKEIESACGASLLLRVEMLKKIGLFNDYFFAYYEDIELSLRAKKFGWQILFCPTSIVYHKGHGSSRISPKFVKDDFRYELLVKHLRNSILTSYAYLSIPKKILFILEYIRTMTMSWMGKKLGQNNIGAMPYIEAFREFLKYRKRVGDTNDGRFV